MNLFNFYISNIINNNIYYIFILGFIYICYRFKINYYDPFLQMDITFNKKYFLLLVLTIIKSLNKIIHFIKIVHYIAIF